MSLDEDLLRSAIGFRDRTGVLSLYVAHAPEQATEQQSAAAIEMRNQVRSMLGDAIARDSGLGKAVQSCIDASADQLEWLTSPRTTGRGRALFIGVESGQTLTVTVQLPFSPRVILDESAYVRPLIAAYDEGREAGLLDVSQDTLRLWRWQAGDVTQVLRREFEVLDEQVAHQKRGPAPANGHMFGRGNSNREQFAGHLGELDQRFLLDGVAEVEAAAKEFGWDRIVLSGSTKLRKAAAGMLASVPTVRVIDADREAGTESSSALAAAAWPLLRSVRQERDRELVASIREGALSGGLGALGMRAVCNALNEGRVRHLCYDDSLNVAGYRSEAGTLHARVEGLVAGSDLAMRPEPLFVERMVEAALSQDSAITPLSPEVAVDLADHEGIGAVLRW